MQTQDKDSVEIFVKIIKETELAILVSDGVDKTWLPKSQIKIEDRNKYDQATIFLPEWLAIEKELI